MPATASAIFLRLLDTAAGVSWACATLARLALTFTSFKLGTDEVASTPPACRGQSQTYASEVIPLRDTTPRRTTPYVTVALIAVNVLVFLWEVSLGPSLE